MPHSPVVPSLCDRRYPSFPIRELESPRRSNSLCQSPCLVPLLRFPHTLDDPDDFCSLCLPLCFLLLSPADRVHGLTGPLSPSHTDHNTPQGSFIQTFAIGIVASIFPHIHIAHALSHSDIILTTQPFVLRVYLALVESSPAVFIVLANLSHGPIVRICVCLHVEHCITVTLCMSPLFGFRVVIHTFGQGYSSVRVILYEPLCHQ